MFQSWSPSEISGNFRHSRMVRSWTALHKPWQCWTIPVNFRHTTEWFRLGRFLTSPDNPEHTERFETCHDFFQPHHLPPPPPPNTNSQISRRLERCWNRYPHSCLSKGVTVGDVVTRWHTNTGTHQHEHSNGQTRRAHQTELKRQFLLFIYISLSIAFLVEMHRASADMARRGKIGAARDFHFCRAPGERERDERKKKDAGVLSAVRTGDNVLGGSVRHGSSALSAPDARQQYDMDPPLLPLLPLLLNRRRRCDTPASVLPPYKIGRHLYIPTTFIRQLSSRFIHQVLCYITVFVLFFLM